MIRVRLRIGDNYVAQTDMTIDADTVLDLPWGIPLTPLHPDPDNCATIRVELEQVTDGD